MAFRGRGRGRGRGGFGGGYNYAKQLPFELFPEIEELGTASNVKEAKTLAVWYSKFEKYCKSSPYYIEVGDDTSKKLGTELETYSNRGSERNGPKGRLSDFINMDPVYVPAELAKGDKKGSHGVKRVRWNPGSDDLDDFISKKLQKYRSEQQAMEKKKDGEEEEEDDAVNEEDEEEDYSTDDYTKNEDFDDDEDDFNPVDNGDDEPDY